MNLYTIGFTKKSAEMFFNLIHKNNVKMLIDIRLNNKSQLAGFAKGRDLKYFLETFFNITYIHDILLAPTKEILDNYKSKKINWEQYKSEYLNLLQSRNILEKYNYKLENVCLLCSESEPDYCHRRLLSEYFNKSKTYNIVHL